MDQHSTLMSDLEARRKKREDELNAAGYHGIVRNPPPSLPKRPSTQQQQQRYNSPRLSHAAGRGRRSPGHGPGSTAAAVDDAAEQEKRQRKKLAYGEEYSVEEDSIRSDYTQNYINSGRRPQNMLQGCEIEDRFAEYPKLARLLTLHSELVRQHAIPPTYLAADLRSFALTSLLPTKFDCILIDPPLEEYYRTYPTRFPSSTSDARPAYWTWDEIAALPIPSIASNPGFIWLWVGSGQADENGVSGLDKGREILAKWGYRRCEDITWLKPNKRKPSLVDEPPTSTLMTHTKEHCRMGIRGTGRRSTDGHFVHCNVDTDVMVWEGDEEDPLHKPPELYNLIENFCLGTRRLELFGSRKNLRPGWLTVGSEISPSTDTTSEDALCQAYEKAAFDSLFISEVIQRGGNLVPSTAEVESLRPRSPGGPNKASSGPLVVGQKTNPQGIGRHTNRSATPSASQQLELQQQQQNAMQVQRQLEMQRQQQMQAMEQQRMMQMQQQQWAMQQQQAQFMGGMQSPMMGMNGMSMMPMHMQMGGMPGFGMNGMGGMMVQGLTPQQMQMMQMQQQQQGYPQNQQGYNGMNNMTNNGQYGFGNNQYQQFY